MLNIYKSVIFLSLLASTSLSSIGDFTYTRTPEAIKPLRTNESLVIEYLGEHMLPTVACESSMRQFDKDGKVLTSNTKDVGIAQLNVPVWGEKAKELGYDIYNNVEDNLKMAKYVYAVQGPKAWVCYRLLEKV